MGKEELLCTFIQNFIQKNKRERCLQELSNPKKRGRFTDKLNHHWDAYLDMRYLTLLPEKCKDSYGYVKNELELEDSDKCYILSNYNDTDDLFFDFKDAFDNSFGRGMASLIISGNGDRLYLETEYEGGSGIRYVGIVHPEIFL